jgi:hypothetical protein
MRNEGIFAEQIDQIFGVAKRKAESTDRFTDLSIASFRRAEGAQLSLFS